MKQENEKDYMRDIAEIRSMMERSSKFLSLSGWAGIMAGMYALTAVYIAYSIFNFNPDEISYSIQQPDSGWKITLLATLTLILALSTAVYFSYRKANSNGEKAWNATSRRLLTNMTIPLSVGGILIIILISKGLIGLVAPLMLLFYGLALYNAGNYTIREVKWMGFGQIALGMINTWYIEFGLIFWALGFGLVHIMYGVYMHFRYER